jgi:hypothetical protein
MKTMLLVLLALVASCAGLTAQEQKQSDSRPPEAADQQAQKSTAKPSPTPELQDAIKSSPADSQSPSLLKGADPASIEDAARKAAHDLVASGQSSSQAKKNDPAKDVKAGQKGDAGATTSGVGEFHDAPDGTSSSSANPVVHKDSSPGKRIHGEVYGAGSSAGRAGSEAVGATSKSGKTSVYVQSDQVSTTQPH